MELEFAKNTAAELMAELAPCTTRLEVVGEPTKEQLEMWYLVEGRSTTGIGQLVGHTGRWVRRRLQMARIPLRTRAESYSLAYKRGHFCLPLGPSHSHWKGGQKRRGQYIVAYAPGHPRAHQNYVFEHILVWEAQHGPLPPGWLVHHLNGQKDDNRSENLCGLPRSTHASHSRGRPSDLLIKELRKRIRRLEILLQQRRLGEAYASDQS